MTQLLSLKGITKSTTLSKSVLYELIKLGKFPKPIRVSGTRRVAWRASEVEATIEKWAEESGK